MLPFFQGEDTFMRSIGGYEKQYRCDLHGDREWSFRITLVCQYNGSNGIINVPERTQAKYITQSQAKINSFIRPNNDDRMPVISLFQRCPFREDERNQDRPTTEFRTLTFTVTPLTCTENHQCNLSHPPGPDRRPFNGHLTSKQKFTALSQILLFTTTFAMMAYYLNSVHSMIWAFLSTLYQRCCEDGL
jgi:hypothetical protein